MAGWHILWSSAFDQGNTLTATNVIHQERYKYAPLLTSCIHISTYHTRPHKVTLHRLPGLHYQYWSLMHKAGWSWLRLTDKRERRHLSPRDTIRCRRESRQTSKDVLLYVGSVLLVQSLPQCSMQAIITSLPLREVGSSTSRPVKLTDHKKRTLTLPFQNALIQHHETHWH